MVYHANFMLYNWSVGKWYISQTLTLCPSRLVGLDNGTLFECWAFVLRDLWLRPMVYCLSVELFCFSHYHIFTLSDFFLHINFTILGLHPSASWAIYIPYLRDQAQCSSSFIILTFFLSIKLIMKLKHNYMNVSITSFRCNTSWGNAHSSVLQLLVPARSLNYTCPF